MEEIMELFDAIFNRRSIRTYKPGTVTDEQVQLMLKAAMFAPSASNNQPWHFIVIRDRKTLDAIPSFHPSSQMLKDAALAIYVCSYVDPARLPGYWMIDCANATQNLLLAAHALGLGAVWLGVVPNPQRVEGMVKLIRLPENHQPFALIAVGVPTEIPPQPDRFKPERIHFEKW
jgi:nitroreductase